MDVDGTTEVKKLDPSKKFVACGSSVLDASILCRFLGVMDHRVWNDKNFRYGWCKWCAMLADILYGWLTLPGVQRHLQKQAESSMWHIRLSAFFTFV